MDPKRLEKLRWLASLRVDEAARRLAQQQARVAQTQRQLEDFKAFKVQSAEPLKQSGVVSVTGLMNRQNRLNFLKKLDEAIESTETKKRNELSDQQRAEQLWRLQRQKEQGYEKLVDSAQHAYDQHETKQADKQALEQWSQNRKTDP